MLTHTLMFTLTYSHTHTHMLTLTHAHTHMFTPSHTCSQSHTHAHIVTHPCSDAHVHILIHSQRCSHSHVHTHSHTHMLTHTHTHRHAEAEGSTTLLVAVRWTLRGKEGASRVWTSQTRAECQLHNICLPFLQPLSKHQIPRFSFALTLWKLWCLMGLGSMGDHFSYWPCRNAKAEYIHCVCVCVYRYMCGYEIDGYVCIKTWKHTSPSPLTHPHTLLGSLIQIKFRKPDQVLENWTCSSTEENLTSPFALKLFRSL